jgi:hypothetical protein
MRPNPARLKNSRLNRKAAAVLDLMRHDGQCLHLEFSGKPCWRLSGGGKVQDDVAQLVIANSQIIADDDALFPQASPQTWRVR